MMKAALVGFASIASIAIGGDAAAQLWRAEEPGDSLQDLAKEQAEYFAQTGNERGSGFRQYMRWETWAMPRLYPSGEFINDTSLSWVSQYRMERSPEFAARKALANAAGIGTGKWHVVTPAQPNREGGDVGRINAVDFDPGAPGTIYAASPGGGLWRTRDDGDTWQILTGSIPMLTVSDIAVDPQRPQTIYILTGDGEMYVGPSMGVLKSTDGGETWNNTGLVWTINQRVYGHRLAINPKNPAILLAATNAGLFRSTDGGQGRWAKVLPTGNGAALFWDILFHPTDPSIVYAASRTDVYRSMDAGATWTQLGGGLPDTKNLPPRLTSDRIRLAVTPASPSTLYVLYGSPSGFWIGLYRSDDNGNSFVKRSSSAPPPTDNAAIPPSFSFATPNILHFANNFRSQSSYDLALAVSPTNADLVVAGGLEIWRSDDGGKSWRQKTNWTAKPGNGNYTHADIHMLIYRGNALFATSDGGVYRSNNNGNSWISIANFKSGIGVAQPYSLCISAKNPDLLYYGAQDNGSWKLDVKGRLTRVFGGDGFVCQIDPNDPNTVYVSVQYGRIYKTTNAGKKFEELKIPVSGQGPWLTPYTLGTDPSTIYACYGDLWLGTKGGSEWKNLTNGRIGASTNCMQVVVASSDPKTIYVVKGEGWGSSWRRSAGAVRPPFFGGGGVFRTTDGGANWENITGSLPIGEAAITDIAVSPSDPLRVWATFSGYKPDAKAFVTSDGGKTWANVSTGLPNLPVNTVAARSSAANAVFVGLDVGVYYRDDTLTTWTPFFDGLPYSSVQSVIVDEANKRIVAATFGRGIWQSELAPPCRENCRPPPPPPRLSQALPDIELRPGTYRGPVDIFESQ
jgi:photosystem II stability/assembly factor-like uncharacterized protein